MNGKLSKDKKKVDQILASGGLSQSAQERIASLLSPLEAGSSVWPELELVLHVAEHDAVASRLKHGDVEESFEEALSQSLQAVLPLLGERFYGPSFKVAERARQRLGAERRKYELVVEHLEQGRVTGACNSYSSQLRRDRPCTDLRRSDEAALR